MTDWSALAREAADALQGTCKSLDDVLVGLLPEGFIDPPQPFYEALDDLVFECEECSWWSEISEMAHDHKCVDCAGEDDE